MTARSPRHITAIRQLGRETIESFMVLAERIGRGEYHALRSGCIVATLFYEPSTRTRLSFESAAHRIKANIIGFTDPAASSTAKGESLIDTIRTVQRYADLIVLRHPAEGAATLAGKVAHVPIVNAGDGGHEHPTQTLFDLLTIRQRFGSIDGLTLGLFGDLRHGRTAHSLARAAVLLDAKLICIGATSLQMPEHLVDELRQQGAAIECAAALDHVIDRLDVLYVTRFQRERIENPEESHSYVTLTRDALERAPGHLLIMHPLPRAGEIEWNIDEDPRAWYFEQLANGVLMRMAILDELLGAWQRLPLGAREQRLTVDDPPWRESPDAVGVVCTNAKCVTHCEPNVMPRRREGNKCAYCDHPLREG